ncbi:MAG: ABC transporter substrate-binding protein [Candidatus Binatia bacterium]
MKRIRILAGLLVAISVFPVVSWSKGPDPKLIEGAKKEGSLTYWTTMTLSQSKQVVDKFHKKYPFIKTELYRTGGGPLLNKILTEDRAGRHEWDVVSGRGELFLPLMKKKLLAPYRSPEASHLPTDLADKNGYWAAYYANPYALGYNTRMVKKTDVPRTYDDLLDPRWKGGKISIDNEAFGLLSGLIKAWGKEKAVAYFKKLAAQNPVPMRGNTARVQLVMAGEFPLVIAYAPTIQRATTLGAPIDWVPLEPVPVQVNPMMLGAKAPHPNVAKLFLDFVLSQEGQQQLVGFQRIPARQDIKPKPARLFHGYKRIVETPDSYTNFSETVKLYQKIFHLR